MKFIAPLKHAFINSHWSFSLWCSSIVCKVVSTSPISKSFPQLLRYSVFLKIRHPPTLLVNRSSQVFLINRNATVKLSPINTIHVKQQHYIGFSIFKFTLKYMLGNVYVNKIHARQCFYIISPYCRGFPHPFHFVVISKGIIYFLFQNSQEEKI